MINFKGFLSMAICAGVFALSSVLIRFLSLELSDLFQASARMFLAGLIALSIFIFRKQKVDLRKITWWQFLGFAFAFPLIIISLTMSINMIKIANAIFYVYIGKMFAAVLLDLYVFKDPLNFKKILSIILLFIGLSIFLDPFSNDFNLGLGVALGLFAGVIASIDGAFRKVLAPKFDKWFLAWLPMLTGAFFASGFLLSKGNLNFDFTMQTYGILIVSSILLIAAQVLMLIGFRYCDINLGTIILSSELIFTIIFALIFFNESPTFNEIIGSVFVVLAIINRNISKN